MLQLGQFLGKYVGYHFVGRTVDYVDNFIFYFRANKMVLNLGFSVRAIADS